MSDQATNERLAVAEERLARLGEGFDGLREFQIEMVQTAANTQANLDRAADAIAETTRIQQSNAKDVVQLKQDVAVQKTETERIRRGQNVTLVAFIGLMTTIIGAVLGANLKAEASTSVPMYTTPPPVMFVQPDSTNQ